MKTRVNTDRTNHGSLPAVLATAALLLLGTGQASAVVTYGTLDNFDVINDTAGDCHGFEIELEGISTADVVYTFGAPYQRYGDATVVPNSTATGVIIRYAAAYDSNLHTWSATTPYTPGCTPPSGGHSCWTGGIDATYDYYSCGCDHFGASLNASPTKTTYRWLVENSASPGTLTPFGSNVSLPAPVWNVTPPAVPGAQPIAAAAIQPPAPDIYEFGDALWVKVYVTELPNALNPEDLDHMVIDPAGNDLVPSEPVEVEIEWVLLQASAGNAGEQEFGGGAEVGAGNEAVSRRFEFYKYTGYYDPETHEARCDNPLDPLQQGPTGCGTPDANGLAGVGDLIGAQNVAVNLAGILPPVNTAPVADNQTLTTPEDTDLSITLTATDAESNPLTYTIVTPPAHGTLSGTAPDVVYHPDSNYNGPDSFSFMANDGLLDSNTAVITLDVTPVNDPPVADAGPGQTVHVRDVVTLDGTASSDIDGDPLTYKWSFTSMPAHTKATLSGATTANPTFRADKAGTYVVKLIVNDGTVDSAPASVSIDVLKGKK